MAVASDVYPHVLAFLVGSGLSKTAKAFKKEAGCEDPGDLDVVAMYEAYLSLHPPTKKKRKRSTSLDAFSLPPAALGEPTFDEDPPKKKAKKVKASPKVSPKKSPKESPKVSPKKSPKKSPKVSPKVSPKAAPAKASKGKKKDEWVEGGHFVRVDNDKWLATVKKKGQLITAHVDKGGDDWGNQAAADLLKVKGKDFRREMGKKKRASWRGGGAIDQSINSVKFDSDSD